MMVAGAAGAIGPGVVDLPALPLVAPLDGVLSPSDLGGAKALPGEPDLVGGMSATLRGSAVHLLLQHLAGVPVGDYGSVAAFLVPDDAMRAAVLPEAEAVLTAPALAHLFGPGSLAEVGVSGSLGARRVFGVLDRVIVSDDAVLAVDFKSNTVVPSDAAAIPEGLLRQLGAYRHVLAQIYPGRRIDLAILWTRTATLMPVPCDMVIAALQRTTRDSVTAP